MRNYNAAATAAVIHRTLISYYLLDTISRFVGHGLASYKIIYYIIYYSDVDPSWSYPQGVRTLVRAASADHAHKTMKVVISPREKGVRKSTKSLVIILVSSKR